MLINDYTSVPTLQACRDRHVVLNSVLVKASVSWDYCYGLESYPRSYESVIDILQQSTIPKIIFSRINTNDIYIPQSFRGIPSPG
jgi:hypothetical protein